VFNLLVLKLTIRGKIDWGKMIVRRYITFCNKITDTVKDKCYPMCKSVLIMAINFTEL
jgi:hypothetical protein